MREQAQGMAVWCAASRPWAWACVAGVAVQHWLNLELSNALSQRGAAYPQRGSVDVVAVAPQLSNLQRKRSVTFHHIRSRNYRLQQQSANHTFEKIASTTGPQPKEVK